MKLIIHFLIIFLIISITSESSLDAFTIGPFFDDLNKMGLLEIILSVKNVYGPNAGVITCEELNENHKGNCKRLVTEYMKLTGPLKSNKLLESLDKHSSSDTIIEKEGIIDEYLRKESLPDIPIKRQESLKMPFLDYILGKKFNSEKSKLISNKIKERIEKCFS